jgi:hypothetical protein
VGVLLRGGNGAPKGEGETTASLDRPAPKKVGWKRIVQVSLFFADLLLLGLAARLALKARGSLGITDLTLCVLALVLGAALTCLALWLNTRLE